MNPEQADVSQEASIESLLSDLSVPLKSLSERVNPKEESYTRRGKLVSAISMVFLVDPMLVALLSVWDMLDVGKPRFKGIPLNYAQWVASSPKLIKTILSLLFDPDFCHPDAHDVKTRLSKTYREISQIGVDQYFTDCFERMWLDEFALVSYSSYYQKARCICK